MSRSPTRMGRKTPLTRPTHTHFLAYNPQNTKNLGTSSERCPETSHAVSVGFEPTVGGCPTTVFKTVTFGHSVNSPQRHRYATQETIIPHFARGLQSRPQDTRQITPAHHPSSTLQRTATTCLLSDVSKTALDVTPPGFSGYRRSVSR